MSPRRTRSRRVLCQPEQTVDEHQQKLKQTKSRKNQQRPTAVVNQEIPTENPPLGTTIEGDLDIAVGVINRSGLEDDQQQPAAEDDQQQSTIEDGQQQTTSSVDDIGIDLHEPILETTEEGTSSTVDTTHHENIETIEETIMENQNSVLEDRAFLSPILPIDDEDYYELISDDEDDFVVVPSDDEEDPRINEAVQILEDTLSLNAPSSPSSSPTPNNRTIDLTDSPKASPMPTFMDSPDPAPPSNEESLQIKCPICFDTFIQIKSNGKKLMSTICGHIFCSGCLPVCVKTTKNCPSCRKTLKLKDIHPIFF